RPEILDEGPDRFDVDASVAAPVGQEQRPGSDGTHAVAWVEGIHQLADPRAEAVALGVLLRSRWGLGHVVPEIDGADEADDDRDARLLAGEDHAGAAAHRDAGDGDAGQVHLGPGREGVDDFGYVAGGMRDRGLMHPDAVIIPQPAEVLPLGEDTRDLSFAV